jgi:DNA polymerase-3 subunit beta
MIINVTTLKALLLFAAKKDVRFYLNGIHFERSATGTLAVATNGHCLAVARLDRDAVEPSSFTVPREHLDNVVKGAKSAVDVVQVDAAQCTLISTNGRITVPLLDGKFPDWRRVVSAQQTGEKSYYHPDYYAMVDKAGQMVRPAKAGYLIQQNGNSVGYANLNDVLHAYVMPLRSGYENEVISSPNW